MDPFAISGPAIISVSGGRTSGYMLRRVLDAHGGALPAGVHAVFANTGREMPATLDFVHAMQTQWAVPIVWIEFTARRKDGYRIVNHNSASRAGEPFAALLAAQSGLPNPVQRSCTTEMKIRTIKRWVIGDLEWSHWSNVVGLRADEPARVERTKQPRRDRWTVATPLADAGVTARDVAEFWRAQPFDLALAGRWEGNCDGCFLKSRAAILRMHADHPERMAWWAKMEAIPRGVAGRGRTFRADREPYGVMADLVRDMPRLRFDETMIEGGQECGGGCGV
ncbi:Nin-like protein [Sandarakinorhabdus sp.]|uniref:Nin-like protein n=1 Tax=Sandarakinorhabdus sp. TaxID=1916663 RepID=UPI0035692794